MDGAQSEPYNEVTGAIWLWAWFAKLSSIITDFFQGEKSYFDASVTHQLHLQLQLIASPLSCNRSDVNEVHKKLLLY